MAWNICLVSDNEAIQHLFTRTFAERNDISLKFYETGEEAKKEASQDSLHLMIASATLPDQDGYTLCKELKEELNVSFPVLIIEDIFEDIDLDRCLEVQTDGFIAKPFEEDLIAEKVDEVLQSLETEMRVGTGEEEFQEVTSAPDEEASASAMMSSEEEEDIMELKDLVAGEEAAEPFEEAAMEEETIPPSMSAALEEIAGEMEKMEAMEEEAPPAEGTVEEAFLEVSAAETAEEVAEPSVSREEIEKMVSESVEKVVQKTLEEKLPSLIRETFAKVFSDISESFR